MEFGRFDSARVSPIGREEKYYFLFLCFNLTCRHSQKLKLTSGIKEVAKRFGKFQQEISFYPLLSVPTTEKRRACKAWQGKSLIFRRVRNADCFIFRNNIFWVDYLLERCVLILQVFLLVQIS